MIIKTEELEGTALDWAVAKAINMRVLFCTDRTLRGYQGPWEPSTVWSQGGPLVEKHEIHIAPMNGRKYPRWIAMLEDVDAFGATPLIAAMRAIVSADLGETVDVPDELCR